MTDADLTEILFSMLIAYSVGAAYYCAGIVYTFILLHRYRPGFKQGLFMLAFIPPMWLLIWYLERSQ
jgi:hypothetical protein